MWWTLMACAPDRIVVVAEPALHEAIAPFVGYLDDPRVTLVGPEDAAPGRRLVLVEDLAEEEAWQVLPDRDGAEVHGGGVLGVQYGLSAALESVGYRFLHPYDTWRPDRLDGDVVAGDGQPLMRRRGLHLHTLHPIEGLPAAWMPSDASADEAGRIADWVVKNGGNHVQWPGLDDITDDDGTYGAWAPYEAGIVDAMHARGLTVGLGVQLFGSGNLQEAYDLLDETGPIDEDAAAIEARVARVAVADWDLINLSFGEFFGEDPQVFIDRTNLVAATVRDQLPGAEIAATVHVGNHDELQVEYEGQSLQYYFLVQFADPSVVPWVHTVMFYNLFEPADGAYLHDEFTDHREFLLRRLRDEQPVGYFPESAYWVAFDNSVPQFLPLYVRSRATDLTAIDAAVAAQGGAPLDDHVLFSSGWEWGYWLHDRATLRMNARRDAWDDVIRDAYAPLPDGEALGDAVVAVAELQQVALLDQDLARWMSGRDAVIDFGDNLGIVSQPDRPTIEEIVELSVEERAAIAVEMDALAAYADSLRAIGAAPRSTRWGAEVDDGLQINAARADFVVANTRAALAIADGADPVGSIGLAASALGRGEGVVGARAADFHDPNGARWVAADWENPTTYDYGYLLRADELCFWRRELAATRNLAGEDVDVPHCAL